MRVCVAAVVGGGGSGSQTLSNQECHGKGRNHLADPLSTHQLRRLTGEASQTFLSAVIRARLVFK